MPPDIPRKLVFASIWLLLGLGLFLGVQAWQREQQAARFSTDGGVVEIRRAPDGHYHWPGTLNGKPVEFLIDTGATASVIPTSLARELDLPSIGTMRSNTAGGVVSGAVVVADLDLQGGLRVARMRMGALPALTSPLLGMDVLGRLRIEQHDGVLRIDLSGAER